MAYSGYNQYSPYWQQTAGQTTPQDAGHNAGQSRTSFQPLSAYQNNQQSSQSSVSQSARTSGGVYGGQQYGNVDMNGAGNARPQESRAGYTITNDRASIDGATALGNLAYASSLGRDGSIQQMSNSNQQQSNANYGTANSYGVGSAPAIQYRTGDERIDSNRSSREGITRSQQATASPSFGYNANNVGYQGSSAGSNTQAQPQYSQTSRSSNEQQRNQYSQTSRPPSGQATQQSHSRLGSQAAPSPALSANQSMPNQAQASKNSGTLRGKEQTRAHTPQSDKRPSSSQLPQEPTQKPQATADSALGTAAKRVLGTYAAVPETVAKRIGEVRHSPAVNSQRDQAGKPAILVEPQYTTVDPSQVFNHIEYSRRQAAAATEAAAIKKAAEDAEAARVSAAQPKPDTPQANGTEPDSAKKAQIELEMRTMIEKMRDYKTKDPSLFTQIWEQVKKSQPPQRAPSQPLQGSASSPIVINAQLPSPSLIQNQLPPESDLPAGDEFPPDFDRGRFPAQRRRRGGRMTGYISRKSGTPKNSTEPAAEKQTAGNQQSPIPPEIAIPTPKVGQIFPDPGSQSVQQAMHQFHQNSKSPVAKERIPESDKQATMNSSTPPPKANSTKPPSQSVAAQSAPPSQPVTAQSAPPPKPGGTYWPESKKTALAEAAQIALTSAPPNEGKLISTREIHELLDQNPSYTQMCEILEYRGFIIDRGQFARTLLKAVPDLGATSSSNNATSITTSSATRATPTNATSGVTASTSVTSATVTNTTSATPAPGSFGKLVKANVNGSVAPPKISKPQPYSVPPAAAFQAPNGYTSPYTSAPSSGEQANKRNPFPRDYHFVEPPSWTPDGPRHHAGVTNQGRPNEPVLHSHLSFSSHQPSESINVQSLDQNGATYPNDVIAHHPTKQEMARKRTFGEIVDLTQTLSDDEELKRQRPKPRTENPSAGPSKSVKNIFNHVAQQQHNSGRTTPKPFKYKYSGRDALLQSYDIVEPMNKRRDALRRSTYNPKNIARDVLLGLGKHPTMAPLNAHLDVLKDRFKAVDHESDLTTFRWDLVDPEGEAKGDSFDTDEEEAVSAVAPTRQRPAPVAMMIAGDRGNIAKDDQAPSRAANNGENPYKRGPYKKTGMRSGIQPIGSADTPRWSLQSLPHAQDINNMPNTTTPDLSRFAYNSPYPAGKDLTTNVSSSSTPGSSVSKRKGRPPGAKNKQVRPDKGIPKKTKTPSMRETPSTANVNPLDEGNVEEIPPTAKAKPLYEENVERSSSIGKKHSIERFSAGEPGAPIPMTPRFTTPSRPSGLRNSMSAITPTDGIAVVIPSRSPSVAIVTPHTSTKKAKSKLSEDLSNGTLSSAPSYTIYRCHWENCPAELHSLETLKKHVRKHRGAIDHVYPCLWADCSDNSNPISSSSQNEDGQHKRLKFKSEAEWIDHVESNHMRTEPELHDGDSVQSSDVEPSDRLSENQSHSRQAVSRVKSPAVLISPVRDSMVLERRRAES